MKLKQRVGRFLVRAVFAPISIARSEALDNLVYTNALRLVARSGDPYAGSTTAGKRRRIREFSRPAEAFEKRFEVVSDTAHQVEARNLLDIGCAEGYMIRRAASELGLVALGLEMDRARIRRGNAQSELGNDWNYGIVPTRVTADVLRKTPVHDLVICFSVIHHEIRSNGIESAIEFLRAARSITGRRFLFDMGGPEETDFDPEWGRVLAFLSGNVVGGTRGLLQSAGFSTVDHVGDTPGFVKRTTRPLFVCTP